MSSEKKTCLEDYYEDISDGEDDLPLIRVGNWSEHVTSSGRKYYHNRRTKISQWEKPRKWIKRERAMAEGREKKHKRGKHHHSHKRSSMQYAKPSTSRESTSSNIGHPIRQAASSHVRSTTSSGDDSDVQIIESNEDDVIIISDTSISPDDTPATNKATHSVGTTQQPEQSSVDPMSSSGERINEDILEPVDMDISSDDDSTTCHSIVTIHGEHEVPHQIEPTFMPATTSSTPGPSTRLEKFPKVMSGTSTYSGSSDRNLLSSMASSRESAHSETSDWGSQVVSRALEPSPTSTVTAEEGTSTSMGESEPRKPTVLPSLGEFFRRDLVGHVERSPAAALEKRARKLAKKRQMMTIVQYPQASAEFRSAKSLLHFTEFQINTRQNRLSYLDELIKQTEEWEPNM